MKKRITIARFSAYLKTIFVASILLTGFVFGFNQFVDPYGLYNSQIFNNINNKKTEFRNNLRLAKSFTIRKTKPSSIVLGTSRSARGMDPSHPGWNYKPSYNLSLNGSNLYEAYRYLQHADAISPVQQVILMADFFMFNAVSNLEEIDFSEDRLAIDLDGNPQAELISEKIRILFSLDFLLTSISTVSKQKNEDNILYLDNGMMAEKGQKTLISEKGGHRAAAILSEKNYYNNHYNAFSFSNDANQRDNLGLFRELLLFCHKRNIDFRIAISPSHARQFETIAAKGIWLLFEDWKRHLVNINYEEADRLGKQPFPLWDFSGYNSLTTEPVPPVNDGLTEMCWYWESSHYKKELGDLVQDRIFGYNHPDRQLPSDFGTLLTPETIEPHLATVRTNRRQWQEAFPEDAAEIVALRSSQLADK